MQAVKWVFRTSRRPKPAKCKKLRAHRRRWFVGLLSERQLLYDAYGDDRRRYFLSYQPDDEDFTFFQERGMEAFVRMERKLLWQIRLEGYHQRGAQAMRSFGAAITGNKSTEESNFVFTSLDFEGSTAKWGITEIGMATISCHQILSPDNDEGITGFNFALAKHKTRKFLFGNTTRISHEIVERTIVDFFDDVIREDPQREIILVSHGIHNEIRILDDLGVGLEALPITGILDTCNLAVDILGFPSSLEHLLTALRIPARMDLLHCAGNDAHYTLQVLLALLNSQYEDKSGRLEKLARQPSPLPSRIEEPGDDWADYLQLDACLQD